MRTIVIGGGASGLVSAITAKDEVILIEKNNKLGKKLLLTGNGKCNYFNNDFNIDKYYCPNKDILNKIINLRTKQKVLEFISSLGIVPLIKDGYFYPRTNQSTTIVNALEKELSLKKVKINLNEEVLDINYNKEIFTVKTNKNTYTCDKLILASGGLAYPKTGSTGEGYNLLKKLGHTINPIYPALTGIKTKEKYDWDKVRSKGRLSFYINNKLIDSEDGEIQFTSYGISGICAFNLSPLVNLNKDKDLKIKINFLNEFDFTKESFINWLDERSKTIKERTIKEIMEGFLNYKLVVEILKKSNIKDKLYNNLTKEEKERLAKNVLEFEVIPQGTNDFDNSQSSTGGIPLTEINIETMESKVIKNLFITGELLDVTGKCGGYNLGFAFLTGLIAGSNK